MFLLRSIKAYLCLNMINFDAVNFSERHSEEVMSFFRCSVYKLYTQLQLIVTYSDMLNRVQSHPKDTLSKVNSVIVVNLDAATYMYCVFP